MLLASARARRPGARPPHEICDFAGTPDGAEACVKGPGASSSRISDALLVAPPFPWLRPPISRICFGARRRDTRRSLSSAGLADHYSPGLGISAESSGGVSSG